MDRNLRLVVVDDSTRARNGLCAVLAAQPGVEVIGQAAQGLEALELVEAKQPQVVLMDVRMPVMNGIQATRAIKQRWPEIRVILISLYTDYEEEALESGADGFLIKGCSAEELLRVIGGASPNEDRVSGTQALLPKREPDAMRGKPIGAAVIGTAWCVQSILRVPRERPHEESRQIFLEEAAPKSPPVHLGLLQRSRLLVRRWWEATEKQAVQPTGLEHEILI